MASLTIGLPRALLHYEFGETWRSFLEALGAEPLVSAPTSRREIERGIPDDGWLVYLGKPDLSADLPYDFYCDKCCEDYFPKAVIV